MLYNENFIDNIYCIIVTHNAIKWIDKCISSLINSSININIVIIDNASTDHTINHIKKKYPQIHLIENKMNLGFGYANNIGIEYSYKNCASHFFLLNQDAWVDKYTIETLIKIQKENDFYIVSPIHLNGNGSSIDNNFFESIIIKEKNNLLVSDILLYGLRPYYYVNRVNAAFWLLSKNAIKNIGGFDPIFYHYGEDMQYCQRVLFHNYKIAIVPSVFGYHDREIFGNIDVLNKNSVYMSLMLNYTDINRSLFEISKDRILLHLGFAFKIFKYFLCFDIFNIKIILISYLKFISNFRNIIKNRKVNKLIASNWLNI
jgi:GT2 family glycosyltransferase